MDRIITYLRQPWLVTVRRSVALLLASVSLWYLAAAMRSWESDLYGCTPKLLPNKDAPQCSNHRSPLT